MEPCVCVLGLTNSTLQDVVLSRGDNTCENLRNSAHVANSVHIGMKFKTHNEQRRYSGPPITYWVPRPEINDYGLTMFSLKSIYVLGMYRLFCHYSLSTTYITHCIGVISNLEMIQNTQKDTLRLCQIPCHFI